MRRFAPAAAIVVAIIAVGWLLANLQPVHRARSDLNRVIAAEAIAKRVWGPVCGGQPITVRRGKLPPGVYAHASYEFFADQQDTPAAYFNCVVTFAPGRIPWPKFCQADLHEEGHLAGYRAPSGQAFVRADGSLDRFHSRNPASVMYPRIARIAPVCRGPAPR